MLIEYQSIRQKLRTSLLLSKGWAEESLGFKPIENRCSFHETKISSFISSKKILRKLYIYSVKNVI